MSDVEITIRYRNGRLLDAIERRWGMIIDQSAQPRHCRPVVGISAQLAGVSGPAMSALLNCQRAYMKDGYPSRIAIAVAEALGEGLEYLFPPRMYPYGRSNKVSRRLHLDTFISLSECQQSAAITGLPDADPAEIHSILRQHLTKRQYRVIAARFGLEGPQLTRSEIAANEDVGSERIRQIEAQALSTLRHPAAAKKLRSFLQS